MSQSVQNELDAYFKIHGHYGCDLSLEAASRARMNVPEAVMSSAVLDVDFERLPESQGVAKWYRCEFQGAVGRCAGEASAGACEVAYYRDTRGQVIQLSPSYAYQTAQEFDGIYGDSGSTVSGNAQVAHTKGRCRDELWNPSYYSRIPANLRASLDADAYKQRIEASKQLRSYQEVIAWLVSGAGGVAMATYWSQGGCWHQYDNQGRITRMYRSPMSGGHSLLWGDWDRRFLDSKGRPFITMFNSHGKGYGDNGKVYLHPDVVEEICQSNWGVYGYSSMIDIKPKDFDWLTGHSFV